jgi:ParD-like antitoxin of type II ParDE toxin-antitoxin system
VSWGTVDLWVALCYRMRMGQPVKLSDALVLDARIAGEAQERSIAGQVEFWAKLGRSMELLLGGRQVLALRRSGGAQLLSEAIASVDTPAGRKRVEEVLAGRPYPHFKQYSGQPGLLIRIDEDGTRTIGRFVDRAFTAVEVSASQKNPVARARTVKKSPGTRSVSGRVKRNSTSDSKERKAWA